MLRSRSRVADRSVVGRGRGRRVVGKMLGAPKVRVSRIAGHPVAVGDAAGFVVQRFAEADSPRLMEVPAADSLVVVDPAGCMEFDGGAAEGTFAAGMAPRGRGIVAGIGVGSCLTPEVLRSLVVL